MYRAMRLRFGYGFESCNANASENIKNPKPCETFAMRRHSTAAKRATKGPMVPLSDHGSHLFENQTTRAMGLQCSVNRTRKNEVEGSCFVIILIQKHQFVDNSVCS